MGGARERCQYCSRFIPAGSDLVHTRYCNAGLGGEDASYPPAKRPRTDMFGVPRPEDDALGPNAGPRREDMCVKTAIDDGETPWKPPSEIVPFLGEAVEEEVDPWSTDASKEEVLEAMRRRLMLIGAQLGAKSCDQMIRLLRHPSYCADTLRRGISSHRGLLEDADKELEGSLKSLRFERASVRDEIEEGEGTLWVRDAVDVIKRQISQLTVDAEHSGADKVNSLYLKPFEEVGDEGERRYSHPMSTKDAAKMEERLRHRVTVGCAEEEEGVSGWKKGRDFMLLLQIYSDKTHQSLKKNSQTHLPLHVAVVNTSLRMKEKMIIAGDSVVGYLPTEMRWDNMERKKWSTKLDDAVSGQGSRLSRLRILQASLKKCLEPLLSLTVRGFDVQDSMGRPMKCHPVFWSYVTDMPEGWDVSSSVHGRCARCCVKKKDLNTVEPSRLKKATSIKRRYAEVERARTPKQANELRAIMWANGIGPVVPYLLSLGSNFGVDLFSGLRYEAMHSIHLGLTRTLLECMADRLRSARLRSKEFITQKTGKNSSFQTIRTRVLVALNDSLELFDRHSPMIEFRVGMKSGDVTEKLNGLFTKYGMASCLEARDFARVLQVLPFLGATCDRLCGEPGTTTRMFVSYVALVYKMTRVREEVASFSDADILDLRISIQRFFEEVSKLYKKYSKSGLAFPKMHALLHVADDIAEGGALAHNGANAGETSHKRIKGDYEPGSKRGDAGETGTLDKMTRADALRMSSGKTERGARIHVVEALYQVRGRKVGARTASKVQAVETDTVQLTQSRVFIPAAVIHKTLEEDDAAPPKLLSELVSDVGGEEAFRWFVDKLDLGPKDAVGRSATANVSGFPYPVLEKTGNNRSMLVTVDRRSVGKDVDAPLGIAKREVQKLVAAHSYYGSDNPVQNFVMIEAGGPEATKAKLHRSAKGKYAADIVREVWIAKVLALVKVRRNTGGDEIGGVPAKSVVEEKALVIYLDVGAQKADKIDEALGCVRLRWAKERDRQGLKSNHDTMRCVYGIVDVATIRGVVHVVRGDYGLGITKSYSCEGDRPWAETWFYLNRFKLERRGAKLFLQDGKKEDDDTKLD